MQVQAAKRPRYLTLDAMRGVAALFVVWRHFGANLGGYTPQFSYLAVDLFFVLSGFVLAKANDRKFAAGQTFGEFMRIRAIRLGPLYTLGLAIGFVAQLVGVEPALRGFRLLSATVLNGVGFPSPFTSTGGNPFPLNHVFWSLFFELWIANLLFGALWLRLRGRVLLAFIALNVVGLLVSEKVFYTVDVGMLSHNIWGGVFRVGFSFFAGVALARLHEQRPPRLQIPSLVIIVALCAVFLLPLQGRMAHLFELTAVLVIFPALIFWGAEAREAAPWLGAIVGDASYALYAIHHPIVMILATFTATRVVMGVPLFQAVAIAALFSAAVPLAAVDTRLRQRLMRRLAGPPSSAPGR